MNKNLLSKSYKFSYYYSDNLYMFRPTLKRNTLSTSNKTYPPKKLSLH